MTVYAASQDEEDDARWWRSKHKHHANPSPEEPDHDAVYWGRVLATVATAALLLAVFPAHAQQSPPVAAPAAAPAAPPAWTQGRNKEQESSPLHPHLPQLTGTPAKDIPIQNVKLPPGFKIEIWAGGLPLAREMALGSKGTVFVGNRVRDELYAVVDKGDHRDVKVIAKGLNAPNGVAFKDGTLFVAERERVIRFDDIENHLDSPPPPQVVIDGLPQQPNHFWKYLTLGPDGWLYFNQGAPFNIGLPNYLQASILRVNPETKVLEQYAQGVRNSVSSRVISPGSPEPCPGLARQALRSAKPDRRTQRHDHEGGNRINWDVRRCRRRRRCCDAVRARQIERAHVVQIVRLEAHSADRLDRLREARIEFCLRRVCVALFASSQTMRAPRATISARSSVSYWESTIRPVPTKTASSRS